jgi:hypothetical protein
VPTGRDLELTWPRLMAMVEDPVEQKLVVEVGKVLEQVIESL